MNVSDNCTNCTWGAVMDEPRLSREIHTFLYVYVLPFIVLVGFCGNITSLYLIVIDKQMRNVSSSVYLTSVLAADTGMLLSLLLVWLEVLGYPLNHLPAVCRVNVYMTYVFGFLTIWYVVCITVETFITICHPTKIKQMCTLFRARVVAFVLLVTALVLYVIAPIINKVQRVHFRGSNVTLELCQPIPQFTEHNMIVSYIDTVLTLLVPLIILVILLTLMTLSIMHSIQRKQKRSTIKKNGENGHATSNRKLPQVRVAKMLYILSLSVVILSAPSHIFRLKSMFSGTQGLSEVSMLVHLILLFMSYSSFSVKFFICVACSKNFRKLFFTYCCPTRVLRSYHNVPQQTMETAA